ncbi:hypothetical protein CC80DRAFT_502931 [Byssothecium circinans]|uniref:Uncharacterized protein n=1 Tax=Byssothecium circinans TaxID=147558 RepID=A0A6A5U2R7_9PLEO|nr:hypothetical protein CC80DRAFT_502931 [Byssothecium circinans]
MSGPTEEYQNCGCDFVRVDCRCGRPMSNFWLTDSYLQGCFPDGVPPLYPPDFPKSRFRLCATAKRAQEANIPAEREAPIPGVFLTALPQCIFFCDWGTVYLISFPSEDIRCAFCYQNYVEKHLSEGRGEYLPDCPLYSKQGVDVDPERVDRRTFLSLPYTEQRKSYSRAYDLKRRLHGQHITYVRKEFGNASWMPWACETAYEKHLKYHKLYKHLIALRKRRDEGENVSEEIKTVSTALEANKLKKNKPTAGAATASQSAISKEITPSSAPAPIPYGSMQSNYPSQQPSAYSSPFDSADDDFTVDPNEMDFNAETTNNMDQYGRDNLPLG